MGDEKSMSGLFTFRKEVKMTQIESLIQLIMPEFLLFLEAKEKDEIVEKDLIILKIQAFMATQPTRKE